MKRTLQILLAAVVLTTALLARQPNGYWKQNCSQYVCAVHGHKAITAQQIWDGGYNFATKSDDLRVVQAQPGFESILMDSVQEGDVLAFHGAHVAWFHNGQWMDSDPKHNGPGFMQYDAKDGWFAGPVRVLRWNR